jgi:hypothetical protein
MPAKCYYTEVINSLLSDHYAQCININMRAQQQTTCYKEVRNVPETNIIDLCSSLQNEIWTEVSRKNDIEKKWDSYSIFNYHFNIACPKVRRNIVTTLKSLSINKDSVIARANLMDLYNPVACGTVFGKGSNDPNKQSLVPYIFFIEKQ